MIFEPVTEHRLRVRTSEKRYSSRQKREEEGVLDIVRNTAERLLKGE